MTDAPEALALPANASLEETWAHIERASPGVFIQIDGPRLGPRPWRATVSGGVTGMDFGQSPQDALRAAYLEALKQDELMHGR